ncbi:hypothetical protein OSTOST_11765 [Ostertagia ostertagi]
MFQYALFGEVGRRNLAIFACEGMDYDPLFDEEAYSLTQSSEESQHSQDSQRGMDYDPLFDEEAYSLTQSSEESQHSQDSQRGTAIYPFSERETDLILDSYVENYEIYHHAISGGSRQGVPAKKRFISQLTEEVNALGFARRTEKQIDQKIRDEIKTLKKYGNALSAAPSTGLSTGPSTGPSTAPLAGPSAAPSAASSAPHPVRRAPSKEELLNMEMANMVLKQDLYEKKHRLADLQIEYWTKRIERLG